jgi:hypothetical protein
MLLIPGWRELAGKPMVEIAALQWAAANTYILDDLAQISRERWCAISYAEVVRDPQRAADLLCSFAGLRWEQKVARPLPNPRHTLTPPAPDKALSPRQCPNGDGLPAVSVPPMVRNRMFASISMALVLRD